MPRKFEAKAQQAFKLAKKKSRKALLYTSRPVISVLIRVTPKRDHIIFYSSIVREGNMLGLIDLLQHKYKIYYIVGQTDPFVKKYGYEKLSTYLPYKNTTYIPEWNFKSFYRFLTAKNVFSANPLYASPYPTQSQRIVFLAHGETIKNIMHVKRPYSWPRASFITGSVPASLEIKRKAYELTPDKAKLIRNPRTDYFFKPSNRNKLKNFGLDPNKPFVMYMPTFRSPFSSGKHGDVHDAAESAQQINNFLPCLAQKLQSHGIQLVFKKHPFDGHLKVPVDTYQLDEVELIEKDMNLYEFIGHSAGLISDYSSIWIDYLMMPEKPIGLFMPDYEAYVKGRGLNEEFYKNFPDVIIDKSEDIDRFISDVLSHDSNPRVSPEKEEYLKQLGMVQSRTASEDIVQWLQL